MKALFGLGLLAGCSQRDSATEHKLDELHLVNKYLENQEIEIGIIDNGEEIYDETHTISSADNGRAGSEEVKQVWPDKSDEIKLTADLKDSDQYEEFRLADAGEGKFTVHFMIEENRRIHFSYSIE